VVDVLKKVVDGFHSHPGLAQKAPLRLVTEILGFTDWLTGPGDDGAAVVVGDTTVVVGGEAMFPPFIEADPRGAGFAAVLANVNDLAAMGAEPLAIVDTIVGPESVARLVLDGLAAAASMYRVPVVGGHLTVRDGPASVSAFGLGRADRLLSVQNVTPGQVVLLACCIEGEMRDDFPFFGSFERRGKYLGEDVRLLARVATSGACVAAKDVSMAGLLGSLAMLLEARRAGATVDLDAIPCPVDVPLDVWVTAFPAYAFLLCAPEARSPECRAHFIDRGLACEPIARIDDSGLLRVVYGGEMRSLLDFGESDVTGLAPL
jgi:selenophosphate synthetase-related protein